MTTRRGILKLVGGGFVVAAAAGGTWYALNGASEEARAAWREAGAPEEKRRRFLSYALLAPNPAGGVEVVDVADDVHVLGELRR
jgi:hypothetical protein